MPLRAPRIERSENRPLELTVIGVAAVYLLVAGWAMANQPFDIWGAFIAAPLIVAVMVPVVRFMFRGDETLIRIAYLGLAAKGVGTLARYWVAFDAYGGSADAGRYHDAGRALAGDIRSLGVGPWSLIPHGEGTQFVENLTGTVYTVVGASKLGGFLWFSVFGFIGVLLCVKAAAIAAPTLSIHRYALFCALSPSLVFWPSSIGKEAWMSLTLGLATYGIARLFAGGAFVRSLVIAFAGAAGAAIVRPHIAAIWVGAGALAALWNAVGNRSQRRGGQATAVLTLVIGLAGLVVVGRLALEFLEVDQTDSLVGQVESALEKAQNRSSTGGSAFTPPAIASPLDYPVAVLRTITRPLPHEITGLSTLIPSLETTAIILIALFGISRLRSLPGLMMRSPFTVFHILVIIMGALAYASFSNLGILVRQRSLLMPSVLYLLCLPVYQRVTIPKPWASRALADEVPV